MFKNIFGSNPGETAKERLASALEKTSEVLSNKAKEYENDRQIREKQEKDGNENEEKNANPVNFGKIFGSVVSATKKHVADAQQLGNQIQSSATSIFKKGDYRRDLSLPLDVEALRDAEVVYVTDRIITMGHPFMQSSTDGDITPQRKLAAVGHLLNKRHAGRYMVWNLSEVEYDYSMLDDEVLPFCFPGTPSPPLGMLLKLLLSIESWLKADSRNIAVIHCLTGKGRTSTVLASFLCWIGEAGFNDAFKALGYIARCKRSTPETITIPSQRRYISYFSNMMDGVRPHQPPLLLKRLIMSEAPRYSRPPPSRQEEQNKGVLISQPVLGCAPYLQIFKGGQLIFTSAATTSFHQADKDELPFCLPSDGTVSFPIETVIQGDVLIRCRHLTRKGQRVSMFRAAFHTGYVATTKVLRLTKAQLDGACTDKRFSDDFFLDLIFDACPPDMASKHLLSTEEEEEKEEVEMEGNKEAGEDATENATTKKKLKDKKPNSEELISSNEAEERRMKATLSEGTKVASNYDSMLHHDSKFWDIISERKNDNFEKNQGKKEQPNFEGPTIGRRRDFSVKAPSPDSTNEDANSGENKEVENQNQRMNSMDKFSISGDFDFGDDFTNVGEEEPEKEEKEDKKDELMEALMAIDDDVPKDDDGESSEELSFENISTSGSKGSVNDLNKTDQVETKQMSNTDSVVSDEGKQTSDTNSLSEMENEIMQQAVGDASSGFDLDDDDDELEDLENFLTNKM